MSGLIDTAAIRRDHLLPSIVGALVKLERAGPELKACCPFHEERSASFTIFDGGRRFHCFGCGASGDVLDFVQRAHGVSLRQAAEMITGSNLPSVHVHQLPAAEKDHRGEEARAIWRAAEPVKGTLAERYLRTRGLHLTIPASIRFTRLRYGKSGPLHPCLVAVVASVDNRLIGIQRTYLNADGTGKASVPKAKLSLGQVSGGAIRLGAAARSMFVCEGLEDGLTLMQELGRTVWVSAGTSNLPGMQFPVGVDSVAIGGDADEPGRVAARKAADVYLSRGLQARTFFPIDGKDFNAELLGRVAA
jgi:DNA primase